MNIKKSRLHKIAATATAFCVAFTQIAIAAPAFSVSTHEVSLPDTLRLDQAMQISVPSAVATIDKLIPGNSKTIFHIQTAHGQYQAEKQIEVLLAHLEKNYGVETLLMEGASEPLDPEIINFFPEDRKSTLEAVDAFVRHSVISGPEVFLLNSGNAKGLGIEDEAAYEQNLQDFAAVISARDASGQFLSDLEQGIERLAALYLSSDARSFLKQIERKETGDVPFDIYLQQLKLAAEKHAGINLTDASWQLLWPMLTRVFTIERLEKKIDAAAFKKQREDFLKAVKPALSQEIYSEVEKLLNLKDLSAKLPDPETSALFESLVRSLPDNFNYDRYSSVTAFCGLLMLKSQLRIETLSDEISRIEDKIVDKLAETKNAKALVSALKDYRLLKKLFALELLPADFDSLSSLSIQPSQIVKKLKQINGNARAKEITFTKASELNSLYDKAVRFYEGARLRDTKMLERIEEQLDATGADKVAVVTGGFHSGPFAKYFEERGYSYALMTPKLTTIDAQGRQNYLDVMQMWASAPKDATASNGAEIVASTIQPRPATRDFLARLAAAILPSSFLNRLLPRLAAGALIVGGGTIMPNTAIAQAPASPPAGSQAEAVRINPTGRLSVTAAKPQDYDNIKIWIRILNTNPQGGSVAQKNKNSKDKLSTFELIPPAYKPLFFPEFLAILSNVNESDEVRLRAFEEVFDLFKIFDLTSLKNVRQDIDDPIENVLAVARKIILDSKDDLSLRANSIELFRFVYENLVAGKQKLLQPGDQRLVPIISNPTMAGHANNFFVLLSKLSKNESSEEGKKLFLPMRTLTRSLAGGSFLQPGEARNALALIANLDAAAVQAVSTQFKGDIDFLTQAPRNDGNFMARFQAMKRVYEAVRDQKGEELHYSAAFKIINDYLTYKDIKGEDFRVPWIALTAINLGRVLVERDPAKYPKGEFEKSLDFFIKNPASHLQPVQSAKSVKEAIKSRSEARSGLVNMLVFASILMVTAEFTASSVIAQTSTIPAQTALSTPASTESLKPLQVLSALQVQELDLLKKEITKAVLKKPEISGGSKKAVEARVALLEKKLKIFDSAKQSIYYPHLVELLAEIAAGPFSGGLARFKDLEVEVRIRALEEVHGIYSIYSVGSTTTTNALLYVLPIAGWEKGRQSLELKKRDPQWSQLRGPYAAVVTSINKQSSGSGKLSPLAVSLLGQVLDAIHSEEKVDRAAEINRQIQIIKESKDPDGTGRKRLIAVQALLGFVGDEKFDKDDRASILKLAGAYLIAPPDAVDSMSRFPKLITAEIVYKVATKDSDSARGALDFLNRYLNDPKQIKPLEASVVKKYVADLTATVSRSEARRTYEAAYVQSLFSDVSRLDAALTSFVKGQAGEYWSRFVLNPKDGASVPAIVVENKAGSFADQLVAAAKAAGVTDMTLAEFAAYAVANYASFELTTGAYTDAAAAVKVKVLLTPEALKGILELPVAEQEAAFSTLISKANAESGSGAAFLEGQEPTPAVIPETASTEDRIAYLKSVAAGEVGFVDFAAGAATRLKVGAEFDPIGLVGLSKSILEKFPRKDDEKPAANDFQDLIERAAAGKAETEADLTFLQLQMLSLSGQLARLVEETPEAGVSLWDVLAGVRFISVANDDNDNAFRAQMGSIQGAGFGGVYQITQYKAGVEKVLPDGTTEHTDELKVPEGHLVPLLDMAKREGGSYKFEAGSFVPVATTLKEELKKQGVKRLVFAQGNDLFLLKDFAAVERVVTAQREMEKRGVKMMMEMVENGIKQKGGGTKVDPKTGFAWMRDTIGIGQGIVPASLSRMFYVIDLDALDLVVEKEAEIPLYRNLKKLPSGGWALSNERLSGDASSVIPAWTMEKSGHPLITFKLRSRTDEALRFVDEAIGSPHFQATLKRFAPQIARSEAREQLDADFFMQNKPLAGWTEQSRNDAGYKYRSINSDGHNITVSLGVSAGKEGNFEVSLSQGDEESDSTSVVKIFWDASENAFFVNETRYSISSAPELVFDADTKTVEILIESYPPGLREDPASRIFKSSDSTDALTVVILRSESRNVYQFRGDLVKADFPVLRSVLPAGYEVYSLPLDGAGRARFLKDLDLLVPTQNLSDTEPLYVVVNEKNGVFQVAAIFQSQRASSVVVFEPEADLAEKLSIAFRSFTRSPSVILVGATIPLETTSSSFQLTIPRLPGGVTLRDTSEIFYVVGFAGGQQSTYSTTFVAVPEHENYQYLQQVLTHARDLAVEPGQIPVLTGSEPVFATVVSDEEGNVLAILIGRAPKGVRASEYNFAVLPQLNDNLIPLQTSYIDLLRNPVDDRFPRLPNDVTSVRLAAPFNVVVTRDGQLRPSTLELRNVVTPAGIAPDRALTSYWGRGYVISQPELQVSIPAVQEPRDLLNFFSLSMAELSSAKPYVIDEPDDKLFWAQTPAGLFWQNLLGRVNPEQREALQARLTSAIQAQGLPLDFRAQDLFPVLQLVVTPENEAAGLIFRGVDGVLKPLAAFSAESQGANLQLGVVDLRADVALTALQKDGNLTIQSPQRSEIRQFVVVDFKTASESAFVADVLKRDFPDGLTNTRDTRFQLAPFKGAEAFDFTFIPEQGAPFKITLGVRDAFESIESFLIASESAKRGFLAEHGFLPPEGERVFARSIQRVEIEPAKVVQTDARRVAVPAVRSESRLTDEQITVILKEFTGGILTLEQAALVLQTNNVDGERIRQIVEEKMGGRLILEQSEGAVSQLDQLLGLVDNAAPNLNVTAIQINNKQTGYAPEKGLAIRAADEIRATIKSTPEALAQNLSQLGSGEFLDVVVDDGDQGALLLEIRKALEGKGGIVSKSLREAILSPETGKIRIHERSNLANFVKAQAPNVAVALIMAGFNHELFDGLRDTENVYRLKLAENGKPLNGKNLWAIPVVHVAASRVMANISGIPQAQAEALLQSSFDQIGLRLKPKNADGTYGFGSIETLLQAIVTAKYIEIMA